MLFQQENKTPTKHILIFKQAYIKKTCKTQHKINNECEAYLAESGKLRKRCSNEFGKHITSSTTSNLEIKTNLNY